MARLLSFFGGAGRSYCSQQASTTYSTFTSLPFCSIRSGFSWIPSESSLQHQDICSIDHTRFPPSLSIAAATTMLARLQALLGSFPLLVGHYCCSLVYGLGGHFQYSLLWPAGLGLVTILYCSRRDCNFSFDFVSVHRLTFDHRGLRLATCLLWSLVNLIQATMSDKVGFNPIDGHDLVKQQQC